MFDLQMFTFCNLVYLQISVMSVLDTTTSTTVSKRLFPSANTRESVIIWTTCTDRFISDKNKITSESFTRKYSIQCNPQLKRFDTKYQKPRKVIL